MTFKQVTDPMWDLKKFQEMTYKQVTDLRGDLNVFSGHDL